MELWTVKEIREYTAMTQAEFSAYSGIPTRSIEQWETGKRTPPGYVLQLLQRCVIEDTENGRITGSNTDWNGSIAEPFRPGKERKTQDV